MLFCYLSNVIYRILLRFIARKTNILPSNANTQTDNQISPYEMICSDDTDSCKNITDTIESRTGSTYPSNPNNPIGSNRLATKYIAKAIAVMIPSIGIKIGKWVMS